MSAASLTSITNSLRKSTSWADDEDDWDYNTWKQQIEEETVATMTAASADLDQLSRSADEEDMWDFEDWKKKVEDITSVLTIEEPVNETIYSNSDFPSSEPMSEDEFAPYYTNEERRQQITYDPAAAYFNEDPPTMHWYCIGKAEGDDRPHKWRYEYTKTWRALRASQPTASETHFHAPRVSSPLACQSIEADGEWEVSNKIEESAEDINAECRLPPDNIQSIELVAPAVPSPIALSDDSGTIELQRNGCQVLPTKTSLTIAPVERSVTTGPLYQLHAVPNTVPMAPAKDSVVESDDLHCEDSDDSAPPEWEHSYTSSLSSPSSECAIYDHDSPLLESVKELKGAINGAPDSMAPKLEGFPSTHSSDKPRNESNDDDNLSHGSTQQLASDKDTGTKTAVGAVQMRCYSLPNIYSLGLRATKEDFPNIWSSASVTSPTATTETFRQRFNLLSTLSTWLSLGKEPLKPKFPTWSDYASVGIAAAATITVTGGLFLAFGRRKR